MHVREELPSVVAIVYLFVLLLVIAQPLSAGYGWIFIVLDTFVSLIFFVQWLRERKSRSTSHNIIHGLSSIPFFLLFGVGTLAQLLSIIKVLRGVGEIIALSNKLRKKPLPDVYKVILSFTCILVYFSLVIIYIESTANPQLQGFEDGMWWAITTVTSVGYGDITPVTNVGRIAAGLLMLMGIGLSSAVGAAFVSYVMRPVEERIISEEQHIESMERDEESKLDEILLRLKKIEEKQKEK